MTAAAIPARPAARPWSARTVARLLRLELRRSPVRLALPLIAALFWFDCYRIAATLPATWDLRTFYAMGQGHALIDFGPFVAGAAAWAGSREGRRGMADLVGITAMPRWGARLAGLAATACWAVGGYAVLVGALFVMIARQATGGTPPWWAVAVGAVGVAAFAALGFAAGVVFAGRMVAPLAAFGAFLTLGISSQIGFRSQSPWAVILPVRSQKAFGFDSGIFYPWLPDVPIARLMLLGGLVIAAAGVTGLPRGSGGTLLRRWAAAVTAAGLCAAGTGVGLAGTSRLGPYGSVIPALHDAATDRSAGYVPVCAPAGGIPACVHPAYRDYLPDVTAALAPLLRQVAGLPGAPARVTQVPSLYTGSHLAATVAGRPPALRLSVATIGVPGMFGLDTADFRSGLRIAAAAAIVTTPGAPVATAAQQAAGAALAVRAGLPLGAQQQAADEAGLLPAWPVPGSAAYAAAQRLAAMPAAAFRAWLAAHLAALRAGTLTLADLP